jgi:hypothetical protein
MNKRKLDSKYDKLLQKAEILVQHAKADKAKEQELLETAKRDLLKDQVADEVKESRIELFDKERS